MVIVGASIVDTDPLKKSIELDRNLLCGELQSDAITEANNISMQQMNEGQSNKALGLHGVKSWGCCQAVSEVSTNQ